MEQTGQDAMSANSRPEDVTGPQPGSSRRQALRTKGTAVTERVKTGQAAKLYAHLNAVDFMNSAMQFSALMVVCLFPVLVVVTALVGGDIRRVIISRMGLDPAAARDLDGFMSSGHAALTSLHVLGAVFLFFSAIAIASTLQAWYERINDLPKIDDWKRQTVYRAVWFVGFVLQVWLLALVGLKTGPAGGKVLIFVCEFAISTVFWWASMYLLLLGRLPWRHLFPGGLATAFCLTGLGVFSALLFSGSITSDQKDYGLVGVMMAILSYLIGFGVCIHLGAVFGRLWNESHQPQEAEAGATVSEVAPAE
jgi:membrane protein